MTVKKPALLPFEPIKIPTPDLAIREPAENFNLRVQEEQNAARRTQKATPKT